MSKPKQGHKSAQLLQTSGQARTAALTPPNLRFSAYINLAHMLHSDRIGSDQSAVESSVGKLFDLNQLDLITES